MKAIVSGQAERAVYWEGSSVWCLRLDGDGPLRCFEEDIPRLMGAATDVRTVDRDSIEQIADELELSWARDRALQLTLILFEADADEEDRCEAAGYVAEFFQNEDVRGFVADRLYSAELPPEADLLGAILSAEASNAQQVTDMLECLGRDQPKIRAYQSAFNALPTTLFGDPEARERFRIRAITSGAWRDLVETPAEKINEKRLKYMLPGGPLTDLDLRGQILARWTADLRIVERREVVSDAEEEGPAEYDRRRQRTGMARETFEAVQRQKEAIKHAMQRGDAVRVGRFVDDLVRFQRERSEPALLAKSLCDLATHAKGLGENSLQLALAGRAVDEAPADGWARCQLADALLCCGRVEESLAEYERSIVEAADHEGEAHSGRAEVLKAMGRFEESLAAYDRAIQDFPPNGVVRNGRAEVLKAMGRFEESLAAYDRTIQEFSPDVFAHTGRAEVLKAMGRFEESLAAYDRNDPRLPPDGVVRNGRAEVLKAMGRFEESLAAYDRTIQDFPPDVFAHSGRAEVLKAMGRFEESLAAYDQTIQDFPPDAVVRNGRLSVLALLERYEEALHLSTLQDPATRDDWVNSHIVGMILLRTRKFEQAVSVIQEGLNVQRNPWVDTHRYFRSALAIARIRHTEFEAALQDLEGSDSPVDNVIRAHALFSTGRQDEAIETLDRLPERVLAPVIELSADLRARYVTKTLAEEADARILDNECRAVLMAA